MPKRVNFIFDWRHKRRLANGCIVTALALSLVACSKGPSQSQDQTNPGSGNPPLSGAERQRRSETPVAPKMPRAGNVERRNRLKTMVSAAGFEPATHAFLAHFVATSQCVFNDLDDAQTTKKRPFGARCPRVAPRVLTTICAISSRNFPMCCLMALHEARLTEQARRPFGRVVLAIT